MTPDSLSRNRRKELKRLKVTKALVESNYPYFGINKKQEISRLLYEISKRQNLPAGDIINHTHSILQNAGKSAKKNFAKIKAYLLKNRYPDTFSDNASFRPYLPKLDLSDSWFCDLKKKQFYPKNVFVEKKVCGCFLVQRLRKLFPKAEFTEIQSLKDCQHNRRKTTIEDYNKRQDTLFIVSENYDFFKKCPCTPKAYGCGYHIFNLGFGCPFECTYCYLQGYTNSAGIILPANIENFFDGFSAYKKTGMRIGTGEFLDSLALDKITGFSVNIAEFLKRHKEITLELKTKSSTIENLLKIKPPGNIVVSWSLNPQRIIDENEFFTASLNQRIKAALSCTQAGYRVGFHFDPVVYSGNWQNEYSGLIEKLFSRIKPKHIAWISIGTFRLNPALKQIIEKRFPENKILDEELLLGYDNKLRYPYTIRYSIYKTMLKMLLKHNNKLKLYLCMENALMWRELNLKMPELL
ncbi:MAG: hypothetical protein U9R52_04035 [Candidatus Omnitrophota bacterium]|nr:hypothetical protein [Candidatus Omnitrophota bacterium]